ncbi:MAG: type IV pilus modification PilV family protein [Acidobacteriota bacterium]
MHQGQGKPPAGKPKTKAAGMTLVEILIALAILLVVTVGILQLFSLSYLVNMGSLARTDLQYRAERVAESIRYLYALSRRDPPVSIPECGITFPLAGAISKTDIPNDPTHACWGRTRFNVAQADAPFVLSYEITDGEAAGAGRVWIVTVTARPATTGVRYLGMAITAKGVRYVAQIPK